MIKNRTDMWVSYYNIPWCYLNKYQWIGWLTVPQFSMKSRIAKIGIIVTENVGCVQLLPHWSLHICFLLNKSTITHIISAVYIVYWGYALTYYMSHSVYPVDHSRETNNTQTHCLGEFLLKIERMCSCN